MPIVKVWNDNEYDHSESFKGTKITVPAKKAIDMEYEEATEFAGQFTGVAPIGEDGEPDRKFFKMIRVEQPRPEDVYKDDGLTNHITGKKASSADELRQVLSEYGHLRAVDGEADKAARAQTSEVESLKAQVAELTRLVKNTFGDKKPPGRPKKEASA